MAEFILFDPQKSIVRAVGFYAISIGISRVIFSINILATQSMFALALGSTFLFMGANLLYSGYRYLKDTSRGLTMMIISTGCLALLQAILLLMNFQQYMLLNEIVYAELMPSVISFFEYLVLLLILDTEELRYSTLLQQVNTKVESICVTNTARKPLILKRDDALVLKHMFDDRSSWTALNDSGPAESEKKLVLVRGRIESVMILQKWSGHDNIFITMANTEGGTVMLANRFSVSDVFADGDDDSFTSVRLFDGERMLMSLMVEPKIEDRKGAPA